MRPTNLEGKPWASDASYFVLQKIRNTARAELNARDERRSQGQLHSGNKYSPYSEVKDDRGTGSTFRVDPVLSSLRCTGEELNNLTCKRWAEFCATPQEEKPYAEELLQFTKNAMLNTVCAAGQVVEDSLKSEADPTVVLPPEKLSPKKREPALIG